MSSFPSSCWLPGIFSIFRIHHFMLSSASLFQHLDLFFHIHYPSILLPTPPFHSSVWHHRFFFLNSIVVEMKFGKWTYSSHTSSASLAWFIILVVSSFNTGKFLLLLFPFMEDCDNVFFLLDKPCLFTFFRISLWNWNRWKTFRNGKEKERATFFDLKRRKTYRRASSMLFSKFISDEKFHGGRRPIWRKRRWSWKSFV